MVASLPNHLISRNRPAILRFGPSAPVIVLIFGFSLDCLAAPLVDFKHSPKTEPVAAIESDQSASVAARQFLEACAASDWPTVAKFWRIKLEDRTKKNLGGLEVISVGKAEPYKSSTSMQLVPYEVRLKGAGLSEKHKLCLKLDHQTGQWKVDGGI